MHEDQVDVDVDTVRDLLAEQRSDLADLPIQRVMSTGTVNALFRIGNDLVARLPLRDRWEEGIEREWRWIPWLSSRITAARVPAPIFKGVANDAFPFAWSIYRWIDGAPYDGDLVDDETDVARQLARYVRELRTLEIPSTAPKGGREPLAELDDNTREAIEDARNLIDAAGAMAVWDLALRTPPWHGAPVWSSDPRATPDLVTVTDSTQLAPGRRGAHDGRS